MSIEANESTPTRAEKVLDGRIIVDQIEGNIRTYNSDGILVQKYGFLGCDSAGNERYGLEQYDPATGDTRLLQGDEP